MPITPSSAGSDPPTAAGLARDDTLGSVPAGDTGPGGDADTAVAESSVGDKRRNLGVQHRRNQQTRQRKPFGDGHQDQHQRGRKQLLHGRLLQIDRQLIGQGIVGRDRLADGHRRRDHRQQ